MTTDPDTKTAFWRSPAGLTLGVFLAVAALFLVLEHGAHLLGAWPLLFLVLCVGMHFFMHRGHGGHGSHGDGGAIPRRRRRAAMTDEAPAYGLWWLVAVNAAIFILFAFSFFKPKTARDWRTLGAFSAFIVALFVEMYGFPLTLYLLAGWLGRRFPALDPLSHDAGHLWPVLFGWSRDPHWSPFHLLSFVLIGGGFMLIASAWRVLHEAQRRGELATSGPYARVRHPQYAGFALIMIGFFLQWPTLLTAVMLPVLLVMCWRLAKREEREVEAAFGEGYRRYADRVPAFVPRLGRLREEGTTRRA